MPLEVVCNHHFPAPIYGGYLPRTGVYCGACCAPGTISACCTWHHVLAICVGYMCMCVWSLTGTWSYVLAICVCGVLDRHLVICVGYMCVWCLTGTWCCQCWLHWAYVLAICMCCGAWSAPSAVSACCTLHMCCLCVCVVVLGAHLVLSVLAALGICVGYM